MNQLRSHNSLKYYFSIIILMFKLILIMSLSVYFKQFLSKIVLGLSVKTRSDNCFFKEFTAIHMKLVPMILDLSYLQKLKMKK